MNIAQIRQLDIGMKNITCSGEVTWAGQQKNIKGTTAGGRDYDFWSQFIVVKDETDKIGVSITLEIDESGAKKGDEVAIEKAELIQYQDNDNEPQLKLQGKIVSARSQSTQQASPQPAQRTNAPQTDDVELRKSVVCAYLACGDRPLAEDVEYWMEYIKTGIDKSLPDNIENQPEDRRQVQDKEIPF